jgi:hypothetical protein
MTFRRRFSNSVVVFDNPPPLRNGGRGGGLAGSYQTAPWFTRGYHGVDGHLGR